MRRALNLELRQAAVRSTKKDNDASFLKREQDREKQNLNEYGEREAEQLRSIQAVQLVQSQDVFDQREQQHRQTTQVQALHLTQQQELRAHHLEMKRTAKENPMLSQMSIRVGMAFGDVIAGVIGPKKPSYDMWGRTVNVASRMEQNSGPGRILVTNELAQLLSGAYLLEARADIKMKGCGLMKTHYLNKTKA